MTRINDGCSRTCKLAYLLAVASVLTSIQAHTLEFAVEPTDTIVEAGHFAVLDCVIKPTNYSSSVLIQWLDQDGQVLTFIGDSYRSQLINGSLYINSVIEGQGLTGTYQCKASLPNVGSIVSKTANLSLASLSGFYQEPRDLTVYRGQKAHFACRVQASPPPKIKWLKDERPLPMDELRMTVLPSGALEIDEVQASDQGTYRCNATGLNTYRLSNKAMLIINEDEEQAMSISPPNFIAMPQSEVVKEGENFTLDCAANGRPKPKITWLKDGYDIDMADLDSRFSMIGSTSSLHITRVREEDRGTYQCRAANREDSHDASATIHVQVLPKFLTKPEDKVDYVNRDVELECSVYGKPEPKVQWLKNGEYINPNEYYQFVNGNNLKIMGLMISDSGIFQCVASNPAGNIQAAASLKVVTSEEKPKTRNAQKRPNRKKYQSSDTSKPLNRTQSLSLFTSLKPEKSARLGDVDFAHLDLSGFRKQHDTISPDKIFHSLKLSDSDPSNAANLGDTAFSYAPSKPFLADDYATSARGRLPGAPLDLKAPVVKSRFVALSWKPPMSSEDVITYSVYYRQEGSVRERSQNTSRSPLEEINISNLQPACVYHFRVVAYNVYGPGESSESLTVTTQSEEHVPSAPQEFDVYATGPASIHVSWEIPDIPNGQIIHYKIYYMEQTTSVEHSIDTKETEFEINGLSIYTEYSVWVVAYNINGAGPATEEKLVRTLGAPPTEPPYNITVEPASTSVVVRWEPPPMDGQNGVITGYKLRYREKGKQGNTVMLLGNERMHVLNNLERGATYQIRLWAINVNGTGPGTDWIDAVTYENDLDESRVPDAPSPMRVRAQADRIFVVWGPPLNQNIKVRNYVLEWGKIVPDMYSQVLEEQQRSFVIEHLDANTDYIISLKATNQMGPGRPVYATAKTQDEAPPESQKPLLPPVGLKAQVLGPTSVVLYWTDGSLSKSQRVVDKRHYVVRYTEDKSARSRYINWTELHKMIDDLKPNTLYEFSVKLVKGRKESPWSMVVHNRTWELALNTEPKNLDVHPKEGSPQDVELTWEPPRIQNGRITGYVILYTDNSSKNAAEWSAQAFSGDRSNFVFSNLQPLTTYYFKIQARNSRGYGPFSSVVKYKTGENVGIMASDSRQQLDGHSIFSGTVLLYLIIGGCLLAVTTIALVAGVLCCRRRENNQSPDRSKKGYQKGNMNIKPPDLWIHHDQMELKALEKNHPNNDGASSSGAMTLPRSVAASDYDTHDNHQSNSLDKRVYVPNYMGVSDDKSKRTVKPKPITLPVDAKPPREPIATATPINITPSQASSDSTPSSRAYPRTQYTISRAHVTIDQNALVNPPQLVENPYVSHPVHGAYEPSPYISAQSVPAISHVPPGSTYAPGMNVLAESQAAKRLQGQGHPLKSFTVPAPPPISAPGTPQPKHAQPQVTIRPTSSPYKKASTGSTSTLSGTPPSRICTNNPPPHTAEEVQKLHPSHSTEELNQEMANLEGLMLTLNAITANEFEC